MPQSIVRKTVLGALLACSGMLCLPLNAETLEELDALSDLSTDEAAGIAAAREQASRGEYLEALATLERVLAVFPESTAGRLIHASYLCEIDDTRGGLVEISRLKERDYGEARLEQARARCQNGAEG